MAGHSSGTTSNEKGAADAQRAKIFTKLGREIQVAVREGGSDPDSNRKLKDVIAKAKSNNMPNDNIQRSIDKAAGNAGDADKYEEIQYEGYGAAGVAFMVRTLTDNRNRTAADVRHYFDKFGGNLGTTGCVSFMFSTKGTIVIEKAAQDDAEQVMMDALEAGADDFEEEEEAYIITTAADRFHEVNDYLTDRGYVPADSAVEPVPDTYITVTDADSIEQLEKLIAALEDNDDVQDVFHNWEQ